MESGNPSVLQLFDPLRRLEDSVTEGNVEVGHSAIILNVSVRGPLEYVFVVLDTVVESTDLLVEAVNFAGLLGIASGDGHEEPLCNGSEDVGVEVRVGCQSGHNGTG